VQRLARGGAGRHDEILMTHFDGDISEHAERFDRCLQAL
jgi:hypothetical protein